MKIGEFFVQLGVKADTFTVKDFVRSMGDVPVSAAAAISSLAGMSYGFTELFKNTLDMSNSLSVFRSETGLSTDELQRWQAVAKQVGVSGDVVAQSLMGITNAQAQIRLGNGSSLLPFGRLGVGNVLGKSPFEIMQEISANSKRMDPAVARTLMGSLGISPEMMRIFGLSSSQFSKMASIGPALGQSDIQAMQDFQVELGRFSIIVEKSLVPVFREIEPYMGDLAKALGAFVELSGATVGRGLRVAHVLTSSDPRMDDFIKSTSSGTFEDYKRTHPLNVETNVTNNIHSTADAEVVAELAGHHVTRAMVRAAKHFDNQGY